MTILEFYNLWVDDLTRSMRAINKDFNYHLLTAFLGEELTKQNRSGELNIHAELNAIFLKNQLLEITHVAVNKMTEDGLLEDGVLYERVLAVAEESRNHIFEGLKKREDLAEMAAQLGIVSGGEIPKPIQQGLESIEFKRRDGSTY